MKNVNELAVVVNGKLDDASREMFQQYAARIVVRENRGLDAAAYKEVMLSYGWDALEAYDEVICLNDTIMGPLRPFSEMFSAMDARDVDFWGVTAYARGGDPLRDHPYAYPVVLACLSKDARRISRVSVVLGEPP